MIVLRNLEKSYSHGVSKTFVLRQVDLEVKEGEFLSTMGPSGAGKSTLLHILGMHDSAWTGEFEFQGYAVHAMKPKELFTQLNQDGTTIIQVTHSEANAAYGRRVIELRDGWVVKA